MIISPINNWSSENGAPCVKMAVIPQWLIQYPCETPPIKAESCPFNQILITFCQIHYCGVILSVMPMTRMLLHVFPIFFISFFNIRCHVIFLQPLLGCPSGVQSGFRTSFGVTWPVHLQHLPYGVGSHKWGLNSSNVFDWYGFRSKDVQNSEKALTGKWGHRRILRMQLW